MAVIEVLEEDSLSGDDEAELSLDEGVLAGVKDLLDFLVVVELDGELEGPGELLVFEGHIETYLEGFYHLLLVNTVESTLGEILEESRVVCLIYELLDLIKLINFKK